jgi:hypothetical protein
MCLNRKRVKGLDELEAIVDRRQGPTFNGQIVKSLPVQLWKCCKKVYYVGDVYKPHKLMLACGVQQVIKQLNFRPRELELQTTPFTRDRFICEVAVIQKTFA